MRFSRPIFIRVLLLASVMLLSPWTNAQDSEGTMPTQVPEFELMDVEGNLVSLKDLRGKVVMINFWATWCPPCVEEMPAMDRLKTAFADKPFEILAINMAEDQESIENFLARTQFDLGFPLLLDPGGKVADKYSVRGLPATMLVDKTGKFVFGGVGPREWDSSEAKAEILPLFDS